MNKNNDNGLINENIWDGIAERLEIMIRDARYGDGNIMNLMGLTVDAELRRLITPAVARTRTGERARSIIAEALRLDVSKVREVRNLVYQALKVFTLADRNPTVTMLKVAALRWRKLFVRPESSPSFEVRCEQKPRAAAN